MADIDSSLPVRTQNDGDIVAKLADATIPSQQLAIDASGAITSKIQASNGDALTATGSSLDVNVTNTVPVSATDLDIRDLSAAQDNVAAWLNDGVGTPITSTAAGAKQAVDVALLDAAGNQIGTAANPIVVINSPNTDGIEVNDYATGSAIAVGATSTHDYTVPGGVTFYLEQVECSASGKIKVEIQEETAPATFATRWVLHNSTANPNVQLPVKSPLVVATGLKVRVIITNKDLLAQNVYSTISGQKL